VSQDTEFEFIFKRLGSESKGGLSLCRGGSNVLTLVFVVMFEVLSTRLLDIFTKQWTLLVFPMKASSCPHLHVHNYV